MQNKNSQEQTIYRYLSSQIQLGFYNDGERFPSAQEIARRFEVSYCPAQRALKDLEEDGLISLRRGRQTAVLAKPYENYLESGVFRGRARALADLAKSLSLLSPAICLEGMRRLDAMPRFEPNPEGDASVQAGKYLYRTFERSLRALGNQTILNLYHDVGAFAGSSFLDIVSAPASGDGSGLSLQHIIEIFLMSFLDCQCGRLEPARHNLMLVSRQFFAQLEQYLEGLPPSAGGETPELFAWEPHKGRTRHCDVIAIDLACKINQGIYPVGTLLPGIAVLADIYRVSDITLRRAIGLLNKLGVSKTVNGVGTLVVSPGDDSVLYKLKDLTLDNNLLIFLEVLQLLSFTCEPVFQYTFPYLTGETFSAFSRALASTHQKTSLVELFSACMKAVVRCCPLAAVREIYRRISILLPRGSVLSLNETGLEEVPEWPELSSTFLRALDARDGALCALAFRRLAVNAFFTTQRTLLTIGVDGTDGVAAPTDSSV